jgi:hypothetical protein
LSDQPIIKSIQLWHSFAGIYFMNKKKKIPDKKENNMNALEDMQVYGAGHEADELLNEEDEDIEEQEEHQNGGIPDGTEDDDEDIDDE